MKNLKKINLGLFAFILGLGLVFTQSAFKPAPEKRLPVYQYNYPSNTSADVKDIAHWEEVDGDTPNCISGLNIVCRYEYDGDITAFDSYLQQTSTTPTTLKNNAVSTKQ